MLFLILSQKMIAKTILKAINLFKFEGTGLQSFYLCRLTPDSLLIFAMLDTEENAKKLLEKAGEWREVNRFEFHDQMVLDGKIEKSCNFTN